MIPYLEPALKGKTFGNTHCEPGLCPVAEALQQRTMQFKTNYREMQTAVKKVNLLGELIDEIGR